MKITDSLSDQQTAGRWPNAGEVPRARMQRSLGSTDWDVDGVRDDVRDYVVEQLGDTQGC